MHFLICGDSFSADTKGWPGKLGATITNRSQRGIGEYKIFQQVYEVEQFDKIMSSKRKNYTDYPTYKRLFERLKPLFYILYKVNLVPKSFYLKYANKRNY